MNKLVKYFTIYYILIILVSGCASYKEVKVMEVDASLTLGDIQAESLSSCTWELLKEINGQIFHHSYDPIRKTWFVIAEFRTLLGSGNGVYNYSIGFEQIDVSTLIQIRSIQTMWGGTQVPTEKIFEMAKTCQKVLNS